MIGVAILGASSHIARDLIARLSGSRNDLLLYARDTSRVAGWIEKYGLRQIPVFDYAEYGRRPHDVVLNFVGVGDPRKAKNLGTTILSITRDFDQMVLDNLRKNPDRRYIFMSSGAAYGSFFDAPVEDDTPASFPLGGDESSYYGIAKFYSEVSHRANASLPIVDLRIFNYFSRTQDVQARFLISDIARAILSDSCLSTSAAVAIRDYLHPDDFHQAICKVLEAAPVNAAFDLYSRAPVDKTTLLKTMSARFGLRYTADDPAPFHATGEKPHYYSISRKAEGIGYRPSFSSLEGILEEMTALLGDAINLREPGRLRK